MNKAFLPIVILFVLVGGCVLIFKQLLVDKGIDINIVLGGNLIIFIATFLAGILYKKSLMSNNPQAIVRSVYGGFMLKFFVLLATSLIYIALAKPINKPALFICMGLYLVYHFLGTKNVLRQKKKN